MRFSPQFFLAAIVILIFISCGEDDPIVPSEPTIEIPMFTSESIIKDLFTENEVGMSTLERFEDRISLTVETTNLVQGHVYNLSLAVFNVPTACQATPCSFKDWRDVDIEKAARIVFFTIPGTTANSDNHTFTFTLDENDIDTYETDVVNQSEISDKFGGLQDALKAEVHVYIRSKGPAIASQIEEQTNLFYGGCSTNYQIGDLNSKVPSEEGECALIQQAIHVASQ